MLCHRSRTGPASVACIHSSYFKIFLLIRKRSISALRPTVHKTAGKPGFDRVIPAFRDYLAVRLSKRLK
jgi:hypothetical protein